MGKRAKNPKRLAVGETVKAYKSGGSLVLTLPHRWVRANRIQPGRELLVIGNRSLLVASPKAERRVSRKIEGVVHDAKRKLRRKRTRVKEVNHAQRG